MGGDIRNTDTTSVSIYRHWTFHSIPDYNNHIAENFLIPSIMKTKTTPVLVEASIGVAHYVFIALSQLGLTESIIRIIHKRWGELLDQGDTTFRENWEGGTHCHGWAAHPAFHLLSAVLGIRLQRHSWKTSLSSC